MKPLTRHMLINLHAAGLIGAEEGLRPCPCGYRYTSTFEPLVHRGLAEIERAWTFRGPWYEPHVRLTEAGRTELRSRFPNIDADRAANAERRREYFRRAPSAVPPPTIMFTPEELAFLIDHFDGANDPIAAAIRAKAVHRLENP